MDLKEISFKDKNMKPNCRKCKSENLNLASENINTDYKDNKKTINNLYECKDCNRLTYFGPIVSEIKVQKDCILTG